MAVVIGVWTHTHVAELNRKNKTPMLDRISETQTISLPQQLSQGMEKSADRTSIAGSMFVNRQSNPPQYWEVGANGHGIV
jgi:hypothetical protein